MGNTINSDADESTNRDGIDPLVGNGEDDNSDDAGGGDSTPSEWLGNSGSDDEEGVEDDEADEEDDCVNVSSRWMLRRYKLVIE